MDSCRQRLIEPYEALLAEVYPQGAACPDTPQLPPEMQFQSWWDAGLLPHQGTTLRHGSVKILETGRWNRLPGPDFTHAEIEINGRRMRGDIEIDPNAQDWERHGHGANPAFDNVVLHVVLTAPPAGWYTRNSSHSDIPILYLPPGTWQEAAQCNTRADDSIPRCRQPLADMNSARILSLLRAAAAYRMEKKRTLFRKRIEAVGKRQAWYEAWATTLGYSANKEAMRILAMRAPIKDLGNQAEAILLGTAGFLVPVLAAQSHPDARAYHRSVWDSWWLLRDQYELAPERALPWNTLPARPINHPQRRIAALAITVQQWHRIAPLLNAAGTNQLSILLRGITHPFWDTHYTLTSAPMPRRTALIGKQRIDDFLANYVLVQDDSPAAWASFLKLRTSAIPSSIQRTAGLLFGNRDDLASTLRHSYAQQALLQIDADFCAQHMCLDCAFPVQLCQWSHEI